MDKFFLKQLERASFAALLEEKKIDEALREYERHKSEIENLLKSFKYLNKKAVINEEIKASAKYIKEKLAPVAEKLYKEKSYDNALKCYKAIYEADHENADNINKYITALEKVQQYDLGLKLAKELIEIQETPENYKTLAKMYGLNQKYHEAIQSYNNALDLAGKVIPDGPDYNAIACHYFNSYIKCGEKPQDAKESLKYFQLALETEKDSKIYLKNTILAAMKAKDYTIEKPLWEKYFKLKYADPEDEFTYSASAMRNGDIATWAKYYDSRFTKNSPASFPKIEKPVWKGQDIKDKILLVHTEQGYGDNFLMWGYAPIVKERAKKVIWVVQDSIADLFKQNDFGVEVIPKAKAKLEEMGFDLYVPCMSLPIVLKLNKDTISPKGGYIKAPADRIERFGKRFFETKKLKVGFAFLGVKSNQKRDIPFDKLLTLDKLNGVELYCLSKEVSDKKLKAFKRHKVVNLAKYFADFADTAAAIENLDVVVSSDNCILNLAGSMGKRTIGVYNYHYEFRWYDLSGDDCGWYTSVKPIVNNEYNDWGLTMKKAVEEIEKIKKEK